MNFSQDSYARKEINKILKNVLNKTFDCFVDRMTDNEKYNFRFFWHGTDVEFIQLFLLSKAFQTEEISVSTDMDGAVDIIVCNAIVI